MAWIDSSLIGTHTTYSYSYRRQIKGKTQKN